MPANPIRVLAVSEIPTPYRLPLYRLLAARPEIELSVVFCALSEPDRPWQLDAELEGVRHTVLRGIHPRVRSRRGTFVYEINPGIVSLLRRADYDVLVVGGYAVFATQFSLAYARARGVPYLLHSESHFAKPRAGWKAAVKSAVLPPLFRGAAGALATGSAAARYLAAYGVDPARIRIFPNTIDVSLYRAQADAARARSAEIRRELRLPERFVLFAGRLVEDKGIGDLVEALELLGPDAPALVVAGEGPLAADLGDAIRLGFVQRERLIELLALAEWTAIPSRVEPWGVIVNEALAAGSPLIVTSAVGAAEDLVVDGVNGRVVGARSPRELADAIAGPRPSADPSRGRIEHWDYAFAIDQFVEAVHLAVA